MAFLEDSLPCLLLRNNSTIQPRDANDDCHLPFLQRAHNLLPGERLRHDNRQAKRQRREEPQDKWIDMVQRQRQQQAVVLSYQVGSEYRMELKDQLAMRERYPFRDGAEIISGFISACIIASVPQHC